MRYLWRVISASCPNPKDAAARSRLALLSLRLPSTPTKRGNTRAVVTARMNRTRTSSRRVNPAHDRRIFLRLLTFGIWFAGDRASANALLGKVPILDVRIFSFPSFRTIGPQRLQIVIRVMNTRGKINVGIPPGIFGNLPLLQIAPLAPVGGNLSHGGLLHQGFQTLLCRRVRPVVQTVKLQGTLNIAHLHH